MCKINPRPLATVAAGVLTVFAWRSCRVEGTRRSFCASFSRSFWSNYWRMSDCRACWRCGRSVFGVRIYDAVPARALQAGQHLLHGSRILRYGLWRSWWPSAFSTGWKGSCISFFFFHYPVSQCTYYVFVCLCLQYLLAPLPDLRQNTYGCLTERKKVVYKRLAERNVKRCVSNNKVVLCKFLIHQHCKLIMKNLKILQRKNEKKKTKRNVEVLPLHLWKKLIRTEHGCR